MNSLPFANQPVIGALGRGTLQQTRIPSQGHRNRSAMRQINNQRVASQSGCCRPAGCAINHQSSHAILAKVLLGAPKSLRQKMNARSERPET
jgi:hypothetical protein